IVIGRKNSSFSLVDKALNIVSYAWELWKQGNALELMDPTLADTCVIDQLLRTIHVALLCVWELWKQGNALELMDPTLADTCVIDQLLRTIHVALLCVQDRAVDRPMMPGVISMLNNEHMSLPSPKRSAFFFGERASSLTSVERILEDYSINGVTITEMQTGTVDFVSSHAVIDAAHRKRVKYEAKCANIEYGFLPFSFSSLGELEKDLVALLKRIRKFSVTQDIGARVAI
nr:G-type lectin S-receptor-like serine/threonine-protein kinase CES101 [Tanacetum cinerariifolium]